LEVDVTIPYDQQPPPEESWIDRRAKLFEAGEYPDKGLTVTEEQLSLLASSFSAPVPVLVEHGESPLELGHLCQVEALGPELFGTIRLTPEAHRPRREIGRPLALPRPFARPDRDRRGQLGPQPADRVGKAIQRGAL
jgi:hypothetical protein